MTALKNGGIVGDEGFEFPQARIDGAGFADMAMNGLLRLEAVASDAENDAFVAWNFSRVDELASAGDGDATGRFGKNTCIFREVTNAANHFFVRAIFGTAAGLGHATDGVVAVRWRADGEGFDDRIRVRYGLDDIRVFFVGLRDRRASAGLGAVDGKGLFIEDADADELLVSLVDLREERSAGHRDDGVLGQLPAELLSDFEAHAFRAFCVVGTEVYVHEAPAVFTGDFGAKAVDLVVSSFNGDHLGAVNERTDNFAFFEVRRNEDIAGETRCGGIGSDGVSQIARRGAGDNFETEFLGPTERHGNHAILEGQGGVVDRVVFDIKLINSEMLGEPVGTHERSEPHLLTDCGISIDGQKFAVAPHRLRA